MVGTTLGRYEVIEPLGAGGMGEVYRARDATLRRDVAIKVLPTKANTDRESLAKLKREARLQAALNHPAVVTIHGFEEVDGEHFLVLELIHGDSLELRLSQEPLRPTQALSLGCQVAGALEAVHAHGIVHLDVKPANVLITPDGRAKVLDFGVARALERPASTAGVALPAAAGLRLTEVVGTVPYLSPEEVRGAGVDHRTDIWAFGCLLYESLVAKRAFARETLADTLAAIVEVDPDWAALPATTPASFESLIRRCLRKDPSRRLHDIADARIEIEDMLRKADVLETEAPWFASARRFVSGALTALIGGLTT